MDFKKERAKKLSDAQKAALVSFVNRHPRILLSKFDADFRRTDAKKLWENESKVFNEIPGTKKTWKQWRKIWHDIKCKRPNHLYRYDVKYSNILKIRRSNLKLSARKSAKDQYSNRIHSDEQRKVLLQFLKTHPKLLFGQYDATFNCADARKLWMELTNDLNAMPGASKAWKQWRKVWHDLRIKFVDEFTNELAYDALEQYMDTVIGRESGDSSRTSIPITFQDPIIQLPIIKEELDLEPSGSHEVLQENHDLQQAGHLFQEFQNTNVPQDMDDDLPSPESPEDEDYKPYQKRTLNQTCAKQKVTKRVSKIQKNALLDFMAAHPKLSCNAIDLEFSPEDAIKQWMELKGIMHNLPGTRKNWIQWRQVWEDMRKKSNISYGITQLDDSQFENPIPITEDFNDETSNDSNYDNDESLESQALPKSLMLPPETVEQSSGDQEKADESQNSKLESIFRLAEEVSGNSKAQVKAEAEYREQHLSLMKRQTEALEAMVEYNRRQQWNLERQLEIQGEFTKTMLEILKKLSNRET